MKSSAKAAGLDVLSSVLEDHECLRRALRTLRESGTRSVPHRRAFGEFASELQNFLQAGDEVLIARALELGPAVRASALLALEESELLRIELKRAREGLPGEQLGARLAVMSRLLEGGLANREEALFPRLREALTPEERSELALRYRDAKARCELAPLFWLPTTEGQSDSEAGRAEFLITWLVGVPVWLFLLLELVSR